MSHLFHINTSSLDVAKNDFVVNLIVKGICLSDESMGKEF